jgi:poly-beta-1,6-N-acetyl-D-glucosamine synthase
MDGRLEVNNARQEKGIKYVIVSPVRDEEQYLEKTIKSVIGQTVQPVEWIIVDDGSHDRTGEIAENYARQYSWIHVLHRPDRGRRVPGSGVMEAFYCGYDSLKSEDWEFIVKLDGDVGLAPDYFERCFERFEQDRMLGMCGGMMYRIKGEDLELEDHPLFHVRGPIKLYRRACWEAIGGLLKAPGWDTVDEVKANMMGWRTRSVPDLKVIHFRPTGAAEGVWRDGVKNGRADYISGYHLLFMIAKCVKRMFQKPYVIGAAAHAYGFATGYLKRIPQIQDSALIRYIRNQQMRRLFFRESIWR